MAAERARADLARAQSELEAAQRFVDPGGGESELALAGALTRLPDVSLTGGYG
jgi:hypothetical protein